MRFFYIVFMLAIEELMASIIYGLNGDVLLTLTKAQSSIQNSKFKNVQNV